MTLSALPGDKEPASHRRSPPEVVEGALRGAGVAGEPKQLKNLIAYMDIRSVDPSRADDKDALQTIVEHRQALRRASGVDKEGASSRWRARSARSAADGRRLGGGGGVRAAAEHQRVVGSDACGGADAYQRAERRPPEVAGSGASRPW